MRDLLMIRAFGLDGAETRFAIRDSRIIFGSC